ncbi:MAG: hypothetical protein V3S89_15595, partial [Desulfobacterales bacterium]
DELIEKLDHLRSGMDEAGEKTRTDASERPMGEQPGKGPTKEEAPVGVSGDAAVAAPPPEATTPSPVPDGESDTGAVWDQLLSAVSEKHPSLAANLSRCHIRDLTGQHMVLQVKGTGFTVNMLRRNKNLAILKKLYRDLFGRDIDIRIEADADQQKDNAKNSSDESRLKKEALRNPRVADAIEIFNGKVIDVKLL